MLRRGFTKEYKAMRHALKIVILATTVALVWTPNAARADGFFSPFAGIDFSNNAGANNRGTYGVNAGWMGAGIAGFELDLGFTPSFFGSSTPTRGDNLVWDIMGNVIIGVPIGGQHGLGVRPYATIGAGLLSSHVSAVNGLLETDNHDPGINAGVGVIGYFNDHVGLRGDLRYFRDVHNNTTSQQIAIDFGTFHFWRASIGLVIR
jgi:hypothetical protein